MHAPTRERGTILFRPNRADSANLTALVGAVPDALGALALLSGETALRLALDIAVRVIKAGELDHFRTVPISMADLMATLPD
jgi:hypothetical protein